MQVKSLILIFSLGEMAGMKYYWDKEPSIYWTGVSNTNLKEVMWGWSTLYKRLWSVDLDHSRMYSWTSVVTFWVIFHTAGKGDGYQLFLLSIILYYHF